MPQHLERRTKLGPFTAPEWLRLCAAGVIALVFWKVAALPFSWKGCVVVVILAPPICAAWLRDVYELGLGHRLGGATRRVLAPGRYVPGVATRTRGYVLVDDPPARPPRRAQRRGRADRAAA